MAESVPLLRHPYLSPSAFTPEALVRAVRAERGIGSEKIPSVCVLDFDGDLTDWLIEKRLVRKCTYWACFHTSMYVIKVDGFDCGIVPRTIGGPYAVLVAEQLRISGADVIIGLASAGRVLDSLPVPSLVIATSAIRDEATSYHYLPPAGTIHSSGGIAELLEAELRDLDLPIRRGCVWTTDAPYREPMATGLARVCSTLTRSFSIPLRTPQIIQMGNRDAGQAFIFAVAIHCELSPQNPTHRWSGQVFMRRIHLAQQDNVFHRVASGKAPPTGSFERTCRLAIHCPISRAVCARLSPRSLAPENRAPRHARSSSACCSAGSSKLVPPIHTMLAGPRLRSAACGCSGQIPASPPTSYVPTPAS
jgi:hypothetical protein